MVISIIIVVIIIISSSSSSIINNIGSSSITAARPMPESIRIWGEWMAPPARMTCPRCLVCYDSYVCVFMCLCYVHVLYVLIVSLDDLSQIASYVFMVS